MAKFLALCLLLGLLVAPVAHAQGELTIPQRLSADPQGRFTTLIAALDAANLTDMLSGQAAYTLLAPTDSAFQTLLDFLGESKDDLLADKATLREILLYQIVPGRLFFRQIASGQPFATALDGRSLQGVVTDGTVTISGAHVSDIDTRTANGVIQVIDRVLLPSDALPSAHARFAQFSPDTPPVDIYINGAPSTVQGLAFPAMSDWVQPPAAITSIAFVPSGKSLADAVIIPADFTLRPNSWTTIAAVGSLQNGTLIPVLIPEDARPIARGDARITVLDALEGGPALNFMLSGSVLVSRLGFPFSLGSGDNDGFYTFDHRAGTFDAEAANYGTSASLTASLSKLMIDAGKHYFFAVVGTPDQTQLVVTSDER